MESIEHCGEEQKFSFLMGFFTYLMREGSGVRKLCTYLE